jgi:hypothetical protein
MMSDSKAQTLSNLDICPHLQARATLRLGPVPFLPVLTLFPTSSNQEWGQKPF